MSMLNPVAEKTVKETLELDVIKKIDFKVGTTTVTPAMYDKVKNSIQKYEIYVLVDPVLLTALNCAAIYQYEHQIGNNNITLQLFDCIILKHSVLDTQKSKRLFQQQTIVHECTHAGFDLLAVKKQTKLENEVAAYIAGALFAIAVYNSKNYNLNSVKFDKAHSTFAEAWSIAKWLYSKGVGTKVRTKDYESIKKSLHNDPLYINKKLKSISANNGVAAATKSFKIR